MLKKCISRRSFLAVSAITAASFVLENKAIGAYSAKIHPKSDYPTVIIGAGLGGLCCGALLARQGVPVTVVEQGNRPGGYACTFDRAGGKFTFDVPLHGTPLKDNTAARVLEDLGVLESLHLVQLPEIYVLRTPKISISLPQRDPGEYIRTLSNHFPSEKEGIQGSPPCWRSKRQRPPSRTGDLLAIPKGPFMALSSPWKMHTFSESITGLP